MRSKNFTHILENLLTENSKYELRALGGGYSDGTKVNKSSKDSSQVELKVSLYGGGNIPSLKFRVPESIQKAYEEYDNYVQMNKPVPPEVESMINQYHSEIKSAVNNRIIKLLKAFDNKAYLIIKNSLDQINSKY